MLKHQKLYFSPTRLAKEMAFKMSSRSVNWYILYGRQFGNSYQSIMQLLFPSLNSSILKHSVGESNKFRKGNKTNRWTLQCRIVIFRISVNSWFSIYTNGYRNKYKCNAERERERDSLALPRGLGNGEWAHTELRSWLSNTVFHWKEPVLLGGMTDSIAEAGGLQRSLGHFVVSASKEILKERCPKVAHVKRLLLTKSGTIWAWK